VVDEARRARYAGTITARIISLLERYEDTGRQEQLAWRIKALGCVLARLIGPNPVDLILQVMALPGTGDEWKRVEALDGLLQQHSRLPTDPTLAVLDPTIEHTIRQGVYNEQNAYLLKRCLCVLPFVDNAARGIARIREILSSARFSGYHLRELVGALARSESEEALDLLIDLASTPVFVFESFSLEWLTAVGAMDLPRAKVVLMGFIDPDVTIRIAISPDLHTTVAEQLVAVAEKDAEIKNRVRGICSLDLSPVPRQIAAEVVAMLGDTETALAGLNLIRDDISPSIPFHLTQAIENQVVERRPYGGSASAYSLVPRSGAVLRKRLFAMHMHDPLRHRSAFSLLGEIEEWRLDYGKPSSEPRHPAIDTCLQWPPLDRINASEGGQA
jgi:hypothetical protein